MKKLEKNALKEVVGGVHNMNDLKINGAIIGATTITMLMVASIGVDINKRYQDAHQTCEIEGYAGYIAKTVDKK